MATTLLARTEAPVQVSDLNNSLNDSRGFETELRSSSTDETDRGFETEPHSSSTDRTDAKTKANRVAHVVLNILLVLLVGLAAVVAVVPRLTGSVPLTVLSGSMQPTFRPGDLVVVRPTPTANLNVGDVVTFQPQSGVATLVTHRIVELERNAQGEVISIVTQGDANNAPDHALAPEQIMGRVWYSVPFIGHVTNGRNALIAISGIGLALVTYAVVLFVKKDDDDE